MKTFRNSHFEAGQEAILTNNCHGFHAGEIVTIANPEKKYKRYEIKITDIRGRTGYVPSKYLDDIK